MGLATKIFRCPDVASVERYDDFVILDGTRQRVITGLEHRKVDNGFDQRSDRATRIERTIESVVTGSPATNDREDLTGLSARDDNCPRQGCPGRWIVGLLVARCVADFEAVQAFRESALDARLDQRIECRENPESFTGQILFAILCRQLTADQLQESRVRTGASRARVPDVQFTRGSFLSILVSQHTETRHQSQNQRAALDRALRIASRVVIGGAAHECNQQRDFVQLQFVQRLAEIELTGQAETMNGPVAVLAQVNFIDVGIQQIFLVEMCFENNRHERLTNFSPQCLPIVEEITLYELLRHRAAALGDFARANIGDKCTQHGDRINAKMPVETAVLDYLERRGQQCRDLVRGDDQPVFAVARENAADEEGVETHDWNVIEDAFISSAQPADAVVVEFDRQEHRALKFIPELEAARNELRFSAVLPE